MTKPVKERLKEITDSIELGIKELFESDRYMQYLRTMSRFHKYSVNNVMLINMQRPNATLVAGFNKWRDQFERHVKKGESGIKIIAPTPFKKKQEQQKFDPITHAPMLDRDGRIVTEEVEIKIPMYKPVTVFDVSQTEGKELPQLAADLTGDVRQYEIFMEALRRTSPVPISIETMTASMDGYFDTEHQDIAIRKGMSEVQTVSAAVHEITHAKLHNYEQERLAAAAGNDKEPPKPKDRATEEVEAESVSYAVCQYYGIQTGENSFGYIANWSEGKELKELRASLEVINKTASGLITDIDRHFSEICKERGVDLTAPEQQPGVQKWSEPATAENAPENPGVPSDDVGAYLPEQAEKLYFLDESKYLHVQSSEDGWDYTFYDAETMRQLDGGQFDRPELPISAACLNICEMHGIGSQSIQYAPLDMIETLKEAQFEQPPNPYTEALREHFAQVDDAEYRASMLPDAPEQTLDEYPMPDPNLTIADLEKYFYMDGDMLPLSKEQAVEQYDKGLTVYAIIDGGGAEMLFEQEEFDAKRPGTLFAITREEWEASPDFDAIIQDRLNHQEQREAAFLQYPKDAFAIYHLKEGEELRDIRFEGLSWLESKGATVERGNYDLVYTGTFSQFAGLRDRLEELWDVYNNDHPVDYHAHSLSVSDIIAVKQSGVVSCHYCDSFDFVELPGFLSGKNPLRALEDSVEQNDNQLDGIINNTPSPSVAELEAQARSGQAISVLDLARASHAEQNSKKKSVLEQLKKQPPQPEHKKEAPKKSAEREI